MPFATAGICSSVNGVGQNASMMPYVLRPNKSSPRPAHIAGGAGEGAVSGNRFEYTSLIVPDGRFWATPRDFQAMRKPKAAFTTRLSRLPARKESRAKNRSSHRADRRNPSSSMARNDAGRRRFARRRHLAYRVAAAEAGRRPRRRARAHARRTLPGTPHGSARSPDNVTWKTHTMARLSIAGLLLGSAVVLWPAAASSQAASSTIVCWFNANGTYTGSDEGSKPAGTIERTGSGDYTSAYYISASDGTWCPRSLPQSAVSGATTGATTVFTLGNGSAVSIRAVGY